MKKKLIIALIATSLCISLFGCGKGEDDSSIKSNSVATESITEMTKSETAESKIESEDASKEAISNNGETDGQLKRMEYKNISFESNDIYEITESENALTIAYEQGKAFVIMQPTEAEKLEASYLDDEAVLNLALAMVSQGFEEKQMAEEYNITISGTSAKGETFVGKLNDNWISIMSIAFTDGSYYYNVYYAYKVDDVNESNTTYSDEFSTMLESIQFINQ